MAEMKQGGPMRQKQGQDDNAESSPEALKSTLQQLAGKFKNGEMTDEEKDRFEGVASKYISQAGTGDHGYYADSPSRTTSYPEYAFYDLSDGLVLEGVAGNHSNVFTFNDVLTTEEMNERIKHLESTHAA